METNSDESVLPGNENGGAKAFDIVSAIPDIEENKYYFLIKKCPAPVQPYIIVDNGKQKKKYNGSSNIADTVLDTSNVHIDYADYLSVPISEEDAKAMHIFQEKVSAFLVNYYKSETNNQNLNNMSNVENVKTKNESDEPGTEFTKENQKELKNTAEDISQSLDDIVKAIKNSAIVESATKNLEEFNSHLLSSSSKESKEHNVTLDNVKIIDTLLRRHKAIVSLIKDIDGLMNELNKALVTLTKQSKLSPVEEKILTKIISIFWQILKSGGKISNSKDMEKCFKLSISNSPIKIGAALCLSYLIDSSCASHVELHTYLKEAHNSNQNFDIFSHEDILMGLGKISLNPESDLSKNSTSKNSSTIKKDVSLENDMEEGNVAAVESCCKIPVSSTEYETTLLLVTKDPTFKHYPDFVTSIKTALRMDDRRITLNIINNFGGMINFETDRDIVKTLCDINHKDAISSALKKSDVLSKDYAFLLQVASRYPNEDILSIVGEKINPGAVTEEIRKQLLSMIFTFLDDNENDQTDANVNTFLKLCQSVDDILEGGDTLLTKIMKNLDSKQLEKVLLIGDFDVNKHNKGGEAPLVLACKNQSDGAKSAILIKYCQDKGKTFKKLDHAEACRSLNSADKDLYTELFLILDGAPRSD